MFRSIAVLASLIVLLGAITWAQADSWLQVSTPHFAVVSNAGEDEARRAALQLERMRAAFQRIFPSADLDTPTPILVLAVADKRNFEALEPEVYLRKGGASLMGYFIKSPERYYVAIWLNGPGLHPYAPVYHEFTHFVLHRTGEWMPLWLDEGLAEYYQNTEIRSDEIRTGKADAANLEFLRRNALLPLTTLLAVDQHSPYYHEEDKSSMFYVESWALVHYLRTKDAQGNTTRLADYLAMLDNNTDAVSAAAKVFGDLDQLQAELKKYIVNEEYTYTQISGTTDVDASSFAVRALDRVESDLARAEFMAHDGRDTEANDLLQSVLHQDSGNARAAEIMGVLNIREGNTAAAQQWCEQAIKLDPNSFLGHTCFAEAFMNKGVLTATGRTRLESSLRIALKSNPSFAPAHQLIGEFLERRGQYEASVKSLQRAIELDPAVVEFRIAYANVLLEMNRSKEGNAALELALKMAHTPEETAAVETAIESAKHFAAAKAKAAEKSAAIEKASAARSASMNMVPPRLIYSPQAEYTEEARQARRGGVCVLSFVIGVDGKPANIVVTKRLGMGLDEKAIEVVKNSKYAPAMRNGYPVPIRMNLTVNFALVGAESADLIALSERAKAGDPSAEFELATAFLEGRGIPKDEARGLALLERAARDGVAQAQFQMGERTYGDGTNRDTYIDAYFWYSLAKRGGVEASDERVNVLTAQMSTEQLAAAEKRIEGFGFIPQK